MNTKVSPVCEWLQVKFEAWRYQKGVRKTLTEFAAHIGITEDMLLAYIHDCDVPKGVNLAKLGGTLGFEIYELVGIKTSLMLDTLPPLFRMRFASAFTEYYETITTQSYDKDSPEAQIALSEMVKKYQLTEVFLK